jgi:hypothetical protein
MVRPQRPCPRDFRETYIRFGWDGLEDRFHANSRTITRWIEESGGDELRQARAAVTGRPPQPQRRSKRYAVGQPLEVRFDMLRALQARR